MELCLKKFVEALERTYGDVANVPMLRRLQHGIVPQKICRQVRPSGTNTIKFNLLCLMISCITRYTKVLQNCIQAFMRLLM